MRTSSWPYNMCIKAVRAFQKSLGLLKLAFALIADALFPRKTQKQERTSRNAQNAQRTSEGIRINDIIHADAETLERIRALNAIRLASPMSSQTDQLALFEYRNASTKAFLWQIKYYAHEEFIKYAADIWSDELIAECMEQDVLIRNKVQVDGGTDNGIRTGMAKVSACKAFIIHPPSSGYQLGTKEFDQMNLLVEEMLKSTGLGNFCEYAANAVEYRQRDDGVTPQHTGSRKERFDWAGQKFKLSNAFAERLRRCKRSNEPENIHIICIDDVTTTGATLAAIERLIQAELGNAAISLSAFAH